MRDVIYRHMAIDALCNDYCGGHQDCKYYPNCENLKSIERLPSAQPEPCEDAVSREAVSEWLKQYGQDVLHGKYKFSLMYIWKNLMELPSAQPERTCVNCGRTVNNGGWYADGGTRCPIEEHYALPKDGYCHLWEKRNVTNDDYPERRTNNANIDT